MKEKRDNLVGCPAVLGFLLATLVLFCGPAFAGQEKYIGFWSPGTGTAKVLKFDSWEEFTEAWAELGKKEMRLRDLEVLQGPDGIKYIGTWTAGKGNHSLLAYDNFADFAEVWKEKREDKSQQLIDVEVVTIGSKNHYIGVWGSGPGGSALFQYNSWEDFVAKWKELAKDNRVLVDIEAFQNGPSVSYVGVWQTGVGKDQRLIRTSTYDEFDQQWRTFNKEDLRLMDIDTADLKGGAVYIGVWNQGTGGQFLGLADSIAELQARNQELSAKKLDLVDFAAINFGKPAKPEAPHGKPPQTGTLYFSKGEAVKTEPVSGLDFPADMPAIVYPTFDGCNAKDRHVVEIAWARAHHHAWRAYQLFAFLDKAGDNRDDLWQAGYTAGSDLELRKKSFSPYAWFGPYVSGTYRYDYIRDAVFMNWQKRYLVKNTVKCRRNDGGLHPCYQNNPGGNGPPSANHIVSGTINMCNSFFDESSAEHQVKTILHEMFHWLAPKGLALLDTHTHWDRNSKGWCRVSTDKFYGLDDVMHAATSRGCWDDAKFHQGDAARNNDTYAYFMLRLGNAVYSKLLTEYPK